MASARIDTLTRRCGECGAGGSVAFDEFRSRGSVTNGTRFEEQVP